MNNHEEFTSEDPLHITSFHSTTIKEVAQIIQGRFNIIGKSVELKPTERKIKSNSIRETQTLSSQSGGWRQQLNKDMLLNI